MLKQILSLGSAVYFLGSFSPVLAAQVEPIAPSSEPPKLEVVAELQDRPANIAVDLQGRIYVTLHPVDSPKTKMMLINPKDGSSQIFPSEKWNQPTDENGVGVINAIGTRATLSGTVTVLDMGDAKHSPRIVEFNQFMQQASGVTYIPQNVLTEQSFLQDYAIDWDKNYYFIADMGQADPTKPAQPSVIAVNQRSNWVRRVLVGFSGLQPSKEPMLAEGKPVLVKDKTGKDVPLHLGLNPITIDPLRDWLYFGPMGAGKLYRVPISKLINGALSKEEIEASVEVVGDKPECDGITIDAEENIYITNVKDSEIGVMRPGGSYRTYIKDPRLVWADGFSFGPDGYLYLTISQLNRSAHYNLGKDTSTKPYLVVKFKPLAEGAIGR